MSVRPRGGLLWSPLGSEAYGLSRMAGFQAHLEAIEQVEFHSYADMWQWSVTHLDTFWSALWDHFHVLGEKGTVVRRGGLPAADWFPEATLNYAENALARANRQRAVVALAEDHAPRRLDSADLLDLVGRVRNGLIRLGVTRDDRVAGYLPNGVEALASFLAAASLGAIWSSCAPEFGTTAVLDRFGQIEPKVLIASDGYTYGGRAIDRRREVEELDRRLTYATTVVVSGPGSTWLPPATVSWAELIAQAGPVEFEPVPFSHPLYVLYSSGTTGPPKAIVHGHGGILLEHLKALCLHGDLGPDDRFFWFSTTGWMMWNFLVSGLAAGSTVILYDGSPGHPDLSRLWHLAAEEAVTYLGTSAGFLSACERAGIRPGQVADLSPLRTVGSTGSPLPPSTAHWVREVLGPDVYLSLISGGTDVCTAFVGGSPGVAVRAGEIPCRYLGAAVSAYDGSGRPVEGEQGELVVTEPMPSMPVGLWGDADGTRYRQTYFSDFEGVWRHGDWLTVFADGACVITGRSDATLNRAGVRLGTAELYSVVEAVPGVVDSLVVHLEAVDGGAGQLILFVVADRPLDAQLEGAIRAALRRQLSPRHVPDRIIPIDEVPRTLSGKKLEIPVKRMLAGESVESVVSPGTLANSDALRPFLSGSLDTLSP
jgi:acetoacetyl-CoA synthetase